MAVPTFVLTGSIFDLRDSDADGDVETVAALAGATVTFTPNTFGQFLAIDGNVVRPQPVSVVVDSQGRLNGTAGVTLLANDPALGLATPIQWQVKITPLVPEGRRLPVWWFEAPASGTTRTIGQVVAVAVLAATGFTKGDKGDASGFAWKGAWSGATTYALYDLVSFQGASYACVVAGTVGNTQSPVLTPGRWSLIAAKGDTGSTGLTGATGATGDAGATGTAATVTVGTTTTGAAGSSASVSNSGSSAAAVLNFTVPRGDVGPTGAPGTPGSVTITGLGDSTTIGRLVCATAVGGLTAEDGANTWAKVATLTVGSSYIASNIVLAVSSSGYFTTTGVSDTAIISVSLHARGAGAAPQIDVEMMGKPESGMYLAADSFKLVAGVAGATLQTADLWVKKTATYGTINFYEISRAMYANPSQYVTYYNGAPWQSAVPTGTYESVTAGLTAFGNPVVVGRRAGDKTAVADAINTDFDSQFPSFIPELHSNLNSNIARGGSLTVTKNDVEVVLTDAAKERLFNGSDSDVSGVYSFQDTSVVTGDVFQFTVGVSTQIARLYKGLFGIQMPGAWNARNVKIEIFYAGAWSTIYDFVNAPSGNLHPALHWATGVQGTNPVQQIRFTLTNINTTLLRVNRLFYIAPSAKTTAIFKSSGGELFGTTAVPPHIQAAGADANIDLNLKSKGSGVVQANGIPVVTTTGAQALSNKTITQPAIVDSLGNNVVGILQRANAVNYLQFRATEATGSPLISAVGTDTNVGLTFQPKGTGSFSIYTATQSVCTIEATGAGSTIGLNLVSKGTGSVTVNGNHAVNKNAAVPATATSTGIVGQVAYDSTWFYVCTATNTWRRAALSSW
jgi:hypothetical protein